MPKGVYIRTEETKRRISDARKGKGHPHTAESKRKLSESKKGNKNPMYGKHLSKKHRRKISNSMRGKKNSLGTKPSDETRKKIREAKIRYVESQRLLNVPLYPTVGKYETQILDVMEKILNYEILRQYRVVGFFLDGYCPTLNLAIEIDEFHHLRKVQMRKDEYRESQVKHELGCDFMRVKLDEVGKSDTSTE